jgi:hypothetical protein
VRDGSVLCRRQVIVPSNNRRFVRTSGTYNNGAGHNGTRHTGAKLALQTK